MNVVAIITARGGSKGLPRKNVLPLAGKPLIAWTISAALQSKCFTRIIVSTDDEEIAQVAREWGAEVPFMRPSELAEDDSSHVDVVENAVRWMEDTEKEFPDYIMLLQPTSPLRAAEDINGAIDMSQANDAIAVVSVSEAVNHPYLTKRISYDGTLADYVSNASSDLRRQVLPPAYALNGAIYLIRRNAFLEYRILWPTGTYAYVMPPERSIDIDTSWEFHVAELIMREMYDRESN